MIATTYDRDNEILVTATGNATGHKFNGVYHTEKYEGGVYARCSCEFTWKPSYPGGAYADWQQHAAEQVAGPC